MLVAVRHARTSYNEDGKERLRGWLNIPLSDEGIRESMDTANILKKLNIPFDSYHTSPLKRAVQSSNEIADTLGVNFDKTDNLKDWNVGNLTGTPIEKSLSKIHDYIDNPNKVIPEGESFQSFYKRTAPFLKDLIESDDNHLVVSHNRVMTLLRSLISSEGKSPDKSILKNKGPIEPGGIMMIDPDWSFHIISSPEKQVSSV